ncbi:hypothetical protein ACWD4V_20655 [Streptomyces tsukubensis]|uniref:hypothetical protein n=1 Tax=Streptomyces tsukubensis TaxID=83656 RepID=UPI0036A3F2AD
MSSREAASADRAGPAARVAVGGLLAAGNLLTGWLLVTSFLVRPPGGARDQASITAAGVPAMSAHIGSWLTEWATFHLVRWRLVPLRWYAVPIAVGTVSLVWLFVLMEK